MRPLNELPFVNVADVYKSGVRAATLERTSSGIVFAYVDSYDGRPIATTLPIGQTRVSQGGSLPTFFAGLLPEGRRLTATRLAIKTSIDDELSLLIGVGSDTVGDVQITPAGEPPYEPSVSDLRGPQVLSFAELWNDAVGATPERTGLPGVQPKVSARMISFPVRLGAGQFILKLNPPEFPHVVENEACFLNAANASGLTVPWFELVSDRDGVKGLLISRFDRVAVSKGVFVRRAQEDGCQVLDRYPADKYSVSMEAVINALAGHCLARSVAARDLMRQFVFAHLTGNGDQHAKNLSIVFDGEWAASPCYDVPSTYLYKDHTTALSIDGQRRQDVTRRHVLDLASVVGVRPKAAETMLNDVIDRVPLWLDFIDALPFDQRRIDKLRSLIKHRRKLFASAP
jgi:serine/threonine-protein kinase HipA